ncbi:MAG: translational GTPase TypA [Candidatus Binatia bacterium]|nr:translational GTPase TypA [Candidatus Binatia bacterium]
MRNIAIIAHVDHGKTTLVDALLHQSGTFSAHQNVAERVMDSGAIERERGLTILAKNTSIVYSDVRINIVDTPGHADFGGEVERTLAMVDGVILLVDSSEGPLPQTRFVLRKALEAGLAPIVCVNKIDRADARVAEVLDEIYGLFIDLDANETQLEFPVVYTNAKAGTATRELEVEGKDLRTLFQLIIEALPGPEVPENEPTQFQVNNLGYDDYVGRLALGRVRSGEVVNGEHYTLCGADGVETPFKLTHVYGWYGLKRVDLDRASGGDIVALAGIENVEIGDTIADSENPRALPRLRIDEPTIAMIFGVNTSPWAGREGKYVTSRKLRERLEMEAHRNVSLKVEETGFPDKIRVCGRGELQLAILIETMRREGYEIEVSKPMVVTREVDGKLEEPMETAIIDTPEEYVGVISQLLSMRKGTMTHMAPPASGRVRLEFSVPSRGLIGFRSPFLTDTRGTGIINAMFNGYAPWAGEIQRRTNGAIISDRAGVATPYALFHLQERGIQFVPAGTPVYEGMVIGEYSRAGDLDVNVTREKKLTNVRASGRDEAIRLSPPHTMGLEDALDWIDDDERVEVTPKSIRIRKQILAQNVRPKKKTREEK